MIFLNFLLEGQGEMVKKLFVIPHSKTGSPNMPGNIPLSAG